MMFARPELPDPGIVIAFVLALAPHESEAAALGDEVWPLLRHAERQSFIHYASGVAEWVYRTSRERAPALLAALKRRGVTLKALSS